METLHGVLQRIKYEEQRVLPPTLFIQLDNCSRENKNRYFFAYVESFVAWGFFREIIVSFLQVGHTHIDIDQVFSRFAVYLRKHNAFTLEQMSATILQAYTPTPFVNNLET